MMNSLTLLKSLPMTKYDKIGLAISRNDICKALKCIGIENTHLVDYELQKLCDNGVIELFRMDNFDEDLIYAVRLK